MIRSAWPRTMPAVDLPGFDSRVERVLRDEARSMAHAFVEAIQGEIGDGLAGAYLKGSVVKSWDSIIDYAPEVSDVDLHIRIRDAAHREHLARPDVAFAISGNAMRLFSSRMPEPMHFPRPQVKPLDELVGIDGYLESPEGTVETLHGEAYPIAPRAAYDDAAKGDAVLFQEDARFVAEDLPGLILDRPGRYLWALIPRVSWRVSPAGPRLLTALGIHPWDAWTANRTDVVRALVGGGHEDLADAYASFYLAAWDGYRSGFADGEPAARALRAVVSLFDLGSRPPREAGPG
jgi:hypothetical protein